MDQLQTEISLAVMLIELGVTTVDKVKALFASRGHDDAVLATIMTDVTARLARRA